MAMEEEEEEEDVLLWWSLKGTSRYCTYVHWEVTQSAPNNIFKCVCCVSHMNITTN
jgi:hypothetical protein